MKTPVLLFHPNINQSRVNKAFIQRLQEQNNENITIRDEYSIYLDGKINVKAEQQLIEKHDRIIFQFPMYWYSSPSLLKEWEDQVLEYGWAYGSKGNALRNKQLTLAVTTGAVAENYLKTGQFGHTIDEMLSPFEATSRLIGTNYTTPFITHGVSQHLNDSELQVRSDQFLSFVNKGE